MGKDIFIDFITLADHNGYLHYHAPRFKLLHKRIESNYFNGAKILDIGNSKFSSLLAKFMDCRVDELGFSDDTDRPFGKRFKFDLNNAQNTELWRKDIGTYDIIIFAEVIEHLYTSPVLVLQFLHSLLNENGKLIIQTPNAAVLHKRLKLLAGKNPYMLISENPMNPGHYREYTKEELMKYGLASGFEIGNFTYGNYFDYRYSNHGSGSAKKVTYKGIVNLIYSICPPSFKPRMTLVLNKPNQSNYK